MSCSRTHHCEAGEAQTRGPLVSSQAIPLRFLSACEMSELIALWKIEDSVAAKAQVSLHICADSPEPSLHCLHTQSFNVDEESDKYKASSPAR